MRIGKSRGVTLTELLVAVALLSVGVLSFFSSFQAITKAITVSRARTLAANLAQEKVESLKNYTYYALLITTSATIDNSFTPALAYDSVNYPPETIDIGGTKFQRYTFVSLAQVDNNVISTVSYTYPDTGMKQLAVTVSWMQGAERKNWSLTNLFENPSVNPLDATFRGVISSAVTNVPLGGVLVRTQENPDWNSVTDADGQYTFRVYHGSYTIRASSSGWYNQNSGLQSATAGNTTTVDMQMTRIASGAIIGAAWVNPNLVISQVVGSTAQADKNGFQAEFIELFNPTTYTITIFDGTNPKVAVKFKSPCSGNQSLDCSASGIHLDYINTAVSSYTYYVIANTDTFTMNGATVMADAIFSDDNLSANYCLVLANPGALTEMWDLGADPKKKMLFHPLGHGGSLWLESGGARIDTLGWAHNGLFPAHWEGSYIVPTTGLKADTQFVRVSSPIASDAAIDAYGRAYDSNNNANDFIYPLVPGGHNDGITQRSFSTADGAKTILTGQPAVGAYLDANDLLSGSTQAYAAYITSGALHLLYAPFQLDGVSTGTWIVEIASNTFYKEISNVISGGGMFTRIPNAGTSPAWTIPDHYGVQLDSSTLNGFVAGIVTQINGTPASGITVLIGGGITKTTNINGAYFTQVSSGQVPIIVNPNNADPSYVQSIAMPMVYTGQITTQDFTLSQGGVVRGFITTGTTPLPNVAVTANLGGNQYGASTSDGTGMFTIRNLSTGTYTVMPVLESGQNASPTSLPATITSAGTVTVGTFTVSGAFGTIAGTVKYSGDNTLITSGALIVASSATIPNPPPSVCGSSSAALNYPFYSVSSKADGSYALQVRGGNSYNLRVFYPRVN
ncbi:MAG: carboxypeptidase regulatory-like domain-containing protein, partial [Elusimicrobiota bacterium]